MKVIICVTHTMALVRDLGTAFVCRCPFHLEIFKILISLKTKLNSTPSLSLGVHTFKSKISMFSVIAGLIAEVFSCSLSIIG